MATTGPFRLSVVRQMCCVTLAVLFAAASIHASDNDSQKDAGLLVDRVLKSRSTIKTYHVVAKVATTQPSMTPVKEHIARVEAWYDGGSGKFRTDSLTVSCSYDNTSIGQRSIICRNCERPGFTITTTQGMKYVTPLAFTPNAQSSGLQYDIDWKMLGMINDGLLSYHTGRTDRSLRTLLSTDAADLSISSRADVITITVRDKHKAQMLCEVDPRKQHSPVRQLISVPSVGPTGFRQETEVLYPDKPVADIWYPEKVIHRRQSSDRVIFEQVVTLEHVELNVPIPEVVFTIGGIDVLDGTPAKVPEIKDPSMQPTIRGGQIDKKRTVSRQALEVRSKLADSTPPVPDTSPGFWSSPMPYILFSIALIGCGSFLVFRSMKRSQKLIGG